MRQQKNLPSEPFGVPVILAGPHLQVKGAVDEIRASAGDAFYEVAIMLCIPGKVCLSFFEKGTKLLLFKFKSFYLGFGSSGGPLPLQDAADRHLDQKAAPLPGMFLCMQFCIICYI